MRKAHGFGVNPSQRFSTGLIATLSDGVARHFVGEGVEATHAVADYCDKHNLRVVCLSSPTTIHRDLLGTREDETRPEANLLGRIHRKDLLARP